MTAPRTEEIPQSLEDLARNKQLNVSVQNGSPMTATLMVPHIHNENKEPIRNETLLCY